MEKKKYERPSMEMVLLNEPLLLAGSDKASGSFGYISGGELQGRYAIDSFIDLD